MMAVDWDLVPGLAILAVVALVALWVRRPRRVVPVMTLVPTPPAPPAPVRTDHRTPEQRAADQARTNDAWGLR